MKVFLIKNCGSCPNQKIKWDDDDGVPFCTIGDKCCTFKGIPDWCPLPNATKEQLELSENKVISPSV